MEKAGFHYRVMFASVVGTSSQQRRVCAFSAPVNALVKTSSKTHVHTNVLSQASTESGSKCYALVNYA